MVELDAAVLAFLAAAALLAGAINAIAGGGTLVTFPALLAVGYPAVTANATNAVGVLPGYLGGTIGYRQELAGQRGRAVTLGATSAAGGLAGAALLLVAPAGAFEVAAPFLVLIACGALAAQPLVERRASSGGGENALARSPLALHALVLAAGIYGGYFGGALGIVLLAVLSTGLPDDLQRVNALKGLLSLLVGLTSAACLVLLGPVAFAAAAVMAGGSLVGGRAGVSVARRLPAAPLRWVVVAYGVAVAVALLLTG